jgi:hypothetical protein
MTDGCQSVGAGEDAWKLGEGLRTAASSTTLVICLTLAKWETVSGHFRGYTPMQTPRERSRERCRGHSSRLAASDELG